MFHLWRDEHKQLLNLGREEDKQPLNLWREKDKLGLNWGGKSKGKRTGLFI